MAFPPPLALTGDPEEFNFNSSKFTLGTLTTIVLAHDYICPWCWVGFHHAKRLSEEYGVTFDWRGFELIPPGMNYTPAPPRPASETKPETPRPPSRFDEFLQVEGIELPSPRPSFVRSHAALLGAEFAKTEGRFDEYNEAVYRAYWERHEDISDVAILQRLAEAAGLNSAALVASVQTERFAENVVLFDDEAYRIGIRHVPTFLFSGEEKLAEANYVDLAHATERFLFRSKRLKGKQ